MSKAPCGHADAECVIGNFWTCKSCGGGSKPKTGLIESFRLPPDKQARLDQLNRDIEAGQDAMCKPRLTIPIPYDVAPRRQFDSAVAALCNNVFPRYRDQIAPGIVRAADGYGTHTAFVDPATGQKGIAKHNKMYGVLKLHACLGKDYMLDQVANELDHLCANFVQSANANIDAVVQHRGWEKYSYRLSTLGEIMHLVVDDGLVAQYTEPGDDSVELRIRGYWTVVPV
jgi:hypothetical protein